MKHDNTNGDASGVERDPKGSPKRRRTYIINPGFQWKYATVIALFVFLFTAIISCVLYGLLHHQARMRAINPVGYVSDVAPVIIFFCVVFGAVTAGGVGIWSAFASQRICGPLYVLERYLLELVQGRFPSCRPLRRKDEFKELYAVFARAVETMKERKQQELTTLIRASNIARAALTSDDESRRHALRTLAEDLEKMRRATAESLGERSDSAPRTPSLRNSESNRVAAGVA